jgi:hypothetical protein
MAEAVAALGLAASIIQVTDFGLQFVNTAWKIWRSGRESIEAVAALQTLSQNLQDVTLALQVEAPKNGVRVASSKGIFDAAVECSMAVQVILDSLDKIGLSTENRKRDAVRAAFKIVWKSDDIKALQTRFEGVRSQLTLNLAASLR